MAQLTHRDTDIILTDYTTWKPWYEQLEARCLSLKVWHLVDPSSNAVPKTEPIPPAEPDIETYEKRAAIGDRPPANPSDLTNGGQTALKTDVDYYKTRLESYKVAATNYKDEDARLDKLSVYIRSTVSVHLKKTCCRPKLSIREWVAGLKGTVGIDDEEEQLRARDRYIAALKPMRQPTHWDSWLTEYDHAATVAETEDIGEVQKLNHVIQDFLNAVSKVSPNWVPSFQDQGRREPGMNRKEMMKRFRDHMSLYYPKGRQQKGVFAASEALYLAGSGASTQDTDRDASLVPDSASFDQPKQGSRRKSSSKKRLAGQLTTSKQSQNRDKAAAGGNKCPACGLRHLLANCLYIDDDNAPDWFKPRESISELVKLRLQYDPDVQEQVRALKRQRTQTPSFKNSHTPTPEISTD